MTKHACGAHFPQIRRHQSISVVPSPSRAPGATICLAEKRPLTFDPVRPVKAPGAPDFWPTKGTSHVYYSLRQPTLAIVNYINIIILSRNSCVHRALSPGSLLAAVAGRPRRSTLPDSLSHHDLQVSKLRVITFPTRTYTDTSISSVLSDATRGVRTLLLTIAPLA